MANPDQPQGARPYGRLYQQNAYKAGGNIYPGDFVKRDANGQVVVVAASGSYTASSCGVAMSKAASGEDVLVADHPNQLFVIQADGSDIDAVTDMNLNYAILATAADSTYRCSRHELDSDTGNTTSTLPLRLISMFREVNNALGAQVECVVKINAHEQNSVGTDGI